MKRFWMVWAVLCWAISGQAQKERFAYKIYGQVRGDLFYNSRANEEAADGLFYLYPKDHLYDADGKDLNGTPGGSFYLLYSRLGVEVTGPHLGKARTSAKLETDFRGSGGDWSVLRIRHAYVNLDWGASAVLVGQTWHPLFGDVSPQMLNLSTGAPFQPFNRSPQIRYRHVFPKGVQLTAAAVWQLQYLSAGPDGKSEDYIKDGCVPEIYVGADYRETDWTAGVGMEFLSLKPRLRSTVDGQSYKVNERISSLSFEAHAKYTGRGWIVAGKTLLASNLTQVSMPGGYAVTAIDARTGRQSYTPYRHSSTWLNIVCGRIWKTGLFIGYLKNLGTGKPIAGDTYGVGLDIDRLFATGWQLSYNLPHWKLGAEYMPSVAWYGDRNDADGKIGDTHSVTNHRLLCVLIYLF